MYNKKPTTQDLVGVGQVWAEVGILLDGKWGAHFSFDQYAHPHKEHRWDTFDVEAEAKEHCEKIVTAFLDNIASMESL